MINPFCRTPSVRNLENSRESIGKRPRLHVSELCYKLGLGSYFTWGFFGEENWCRRGGKKSRRRRSAWPVVLLLSSFRGTDLQTAEGRAGRPLVLASSLRQRPGVTLHGLPAHRRTGTFTRGCLRLSQPFPIVPRRALTLALKWPRDAPDER